MRILEDIQLLSSIVIAAIIGILIVTALQDEQNVRVGFHWPSSPKTPEKIAPSSYASEQLLTNGTGIEAVQRHCTGCHSSRLITQNRMNRESWEENIKWMQKTQGLWDLGKDHKTVIDYLSSYYAPEKSGRRTNIALEEIEWYILK